MGLFGWSLPAGCGTLPSEEDSFCEVCYGNPDSEKKGGCICHECLVCGDYGNPDCYKNHGMIKTYKQINQFNKYEAEWAERNRRECEAEKLFTQQEQEDW